MTNPVGTVMTSHTGQSMKKTQAGWVRGITDGKEEKELSL